MKFGYAVELNTTNMCVKFQSILWVFIKSYGRTHFLLIQKSCNLQDVLGVLCLILLQNLKQFWRN